MDRPFPLPVHHLVRPITIDIPTAVGTALRALPRVVALRSRVISEIPQFDIALYDKLEAYTQALSQAHTQFVIASTPAGTFDKVAADAKALRRLLLTDASVLTQP